MEELQRQINSLKQELETLKNARDLNHNELMFNYFNTYKNIINIDNVASYSTNLNRTISLSGDPQYITVVENPINTAIITLDGVDYRIALYALT